MLLAQLVETSQWVAQTPRRLQKVGLLAECLRQLPAGQRGAGATLLAGMMPGGRVGVGYAAAYGGEIAPAREASLTLKDTGALLTALAAVSGAGSLAQRNAVLQGFLGRATLAEQAFIRALLTGGVRQGAMEALVLDALAQAASIEVAAIRRARMFAGDLAAVAEASFEGAHALAGFGMQLFKPVLPMLAHPAQNMADAMARLGTAALELKLDGARVQLHRNAQQVRIYSRELNDVTAALPEVVDAALALPVTQVVLDGEVVAVKPDGSHHPFQTTMRRFGRKHDDPQLRAQLPVHAVFFDCLHLDGVTLVDQPTAERVAALTRICPPTLRVPRLVTDNAQAAQAFLDGFLASGHEGVMAKALDGPYEAGKRGQNWLKIKKVHTLDLVVLAVEWGSGRRKGWLSNIHLGARDSVGGGFVMLGKTFKGMTDAMLRWQTEHFLELETGRQRHVVLVRPETVVEVAFNDVQVSSQYPGGVALRLARVKRYRPDKSASEADTLEQVKALVP